MPGLPFPISEFLAGNVADTSLLIRLFQQFDNPAQWPAPSDFQEAAYDGDAAASGRNGQSHAGRRRRVDILANATAPLCDRAK